MNSARFMPALMSHPSSARFRIEGNPDMLASIFR
jgi:hypothetical protein